jgi:hypothetical protein
LVAWFECADPKSPTLVVYDTGSGREVVHQPMPFCANTVPTGPNVAGCDLAAVVGEHIYFTWIRDMRPSIERRFSYDVTTGRRSPATARSFADDVRSNPRGLVIGNAWETAHHEGSPGDDLGFRAVGTRLAAFAKGEANSESPTTAFDTATHQAVKLSLPPGYHPTKGTHYRLFEWLDDNTVALAGGPDYDLSSADIITCRLSDGRCRLAVKAGPAGLIRVMPAQVLPG